MGRLLYRRSDASEPVSPYLQAITSRDASFDSDQSHFSGPPPRWEDSGPAVNRRPAPYLGHEWEWSSVNADEFEIEGWACPVCGEGPPTGLSCGEALARGVMDR